MKSLLRQPWMQAALARLLAAYLGFALRTTRWRLEGAAHVAPYIAGAPCVVAFWHERLPLMPALWLMARRQGLAGRIHVLVSRHRDGRFIGTVVRRFGVDLVFGSSGSRDKSRGGSAGVRALLGLLAAGDQVAITPDGPRGPRRQAAPGVAQIAALSGVPVLPAAAQTTRHRLLPGWDRMILPLPFGRGVVVCGPVLLVPRDSWQDATARIAAALDEAAARADALCAA